jgi:AcrR family transcriptional regulator
MPRISAKERDQYRQERRESILDAAITVFGKKGFDGANVEDIARAAGIGKGTVYLYFKSKENIFGAIVSERSLLPRMTQLLSMAGIPLEERLTQIADGYLEFIIEYQSIFRLIFSDSQRFPSHAEQVYTGLILKGNQLLADYLADQAKAGKIRKLDNPLITARAFIGMLMIYALTQEILGGKRFTPIQPKAWVRETVRLFLQGVQNQDPA